MLTINALINVNEIAKCIESTDGVELLVTPRKLIVVSKSIEDEFFDINTSSTNPYNRNFNELIGL